MYVTGLLSDFMSRMHQGAVDTGSFASYITEGNLYIGSGTGVVSPQMSGQWEREARQRSFLISGTGAFTQLNQQQFRTLLPLPPEIDINAASNATQTSSGQPIVWSWSALPNGGAGVSGIRVYFCQDPVTCVPTFSTALAATGVSFTNNVVPSFNTAFYRVYLGVVGDGITYRAVEVTGSLGAAHVTNGTLDTA
jgi:hypothetical protein